MVKKNNSLQTEDIYAEIDSVKVLEFPDNKGWSKVISDATSFMDTLSPLEINNFEDVEHYLKMAYAYRMNDIQQHLIMLDWNDVRQPLVQGECKSILILPSVKADSPENLMNNILSYCDKYINQEEDTYMIHYFLPANVDNQTFYYLMERHRVICPKFIKCRPVVGCSLLSDATLPYMAVMVVYKCSKA